MAENILFSFLESLVSSLVQFLISKTKTIKFEQFKLSVKIPLVKFCDLFMSIHMKKRIIGKLFNIST